MSLSYQEMAALEEGEATEVAAQREGEERENRESLLAAFEGRGGSVGGGGASDGDATGSDRAAADAAAAAAAAAEVGRASDAAWGRGLMAAIDDALAVEDAEEVALAAAKRRRRDEAAAGKGGATLNDIVDVNLMDATSSSSSSSSSESESEGGGRAAGKERNAPDSASGAGSSAGEDSVRTSHFWHLEHDVSPPVTGALTFSRMTVTPPGADGDAAAAAVERALVEGRGHPAPSALHPAATLWLTAAVAHLRDARARLARNLAEGRAAAASGALSPAALAAAGMPLAAAEAVVSTLATVPLSSLPAADKAWLRSLTVEQLELLLAQVAARRRGVTAPGSLLVAASASEKATAAAAAAAVDASPLSSRLARVDAVLAVLTAAKAGAPLAGADAAHLVRYPTLRTLHAQLLAAVMPPASPASADASSSAPAGAAAASAEVPVPGFSDRQSAAAARLAQYRGVLGLELARLQAAMAQASAVVAAADPAVDASIADAGADAAAATAGGHVPAATVLSGGTHAQVDIPMPAPAPGSGSAAPSGLEIARIVRAMPSPATPADGEAGFELVGQANAAAGASAAAGIGGESDSEAHASKAAAAARPASADAAEVSAAAVAAVETYGAAACALAKRLNEGHLPSALQPLSLILTPAEWSSLVTSVLVAAPSRSGHINHPPAFTPVANPAADAAAGSGAGAGSAASPAAGVAVAEPTTAAEEEALAEATAAALTASGMRTLLSSEAEARAALESCLRAMEAKHASASDPALKAAAAKAREHVEWMLNAAKAGAFDGREGSLGHMLSTLTTAAEEVAAATAAQAAAAAGAAGSATVRRNLNLSTRSSFRDAPALLTWYMKRHNAATPEGVMGRAVVTPWDLMEEESAAGAS